MTDINEKQKWGNKKAFDKGWLRIYGVECPYCAGMGEYADNKIATPCLFCEGYGRVDPRRIKHD